MSVPTPARARALSGAGAGSDLRRASTPSGLVSGLAGADATASSSAASSQVVGSGSGSAAVANAGGASRADQIIYRFYLKTVGILVDGRVTHFGAQRGERKKDKWVGLSGPVRQCGSVRLSLSCIWLP